MKVGGKTRPGGTFLEVSIDACPGHGGDLVPLPFRLVMPGLLPDELPPELALPWLLFGLERFRGPSPSAGAGGDACCCCACGGLGADVGIRGSPCQDCNGDSIYNIK